MPDFYNLVHGLPPELFNEIQNLVFTPEYHVAVITKDYNPPKFLHIDRTRRAEYAKAYYSQTCFEVNNTFYFFKWLANLNRSHRLLITQIQVRVRVDRARLRTQSFPDTESRREHETQEWCARANLASTLGLMGMDFERDDLGLEYEVSEGVLDPDDTGPEPDASLYYTACAFSRLREYFDFGLGIMQDNKKVPRR